MPLLSLFMGTFLGASAPTLFCDTSWAKGDRLGFVGVTVGDRYEPMSMKLSIWSRDGWSSGDIVLDPSSRALPGTMTGATFLTRFTRRPRLPVTMRVYADGVLRWRRRIDVPSWPIGSMPKKPSVGRDAPGIATYVSTADDGRPVATPAELFIELTDADGRAVGRSRMAVLDVDAVTELTAALQRVEKQLAARECRQPPPLID
jgi:hypothetical protein